MAKSSLLLPDRCGQEQCADGEQYAKKQTTGGGASEDGTGGEIGPGCGQDVDYVFLLRTSAIHASMMALGLASVHQLHHGGEAVADYGGTDDYQVSLRFGAEIRDVPFLIYIRQEQQKRPLHHKLNVFQLIAIYNVCFGTKQEGAQDVIDGLVDEGLLLRSKSGKLSMGKEYKRIAKEMSGVKNGDGNGQLDGQLDGQLRDQLEGQLNESQKITLEYIRQHEGDNTTAVSNGLDKPFRTIDKHIKVLLKLGLIERRGGKRTGGYYPL